MPPVPGKAMEKHDSEQSARPVLLLTSIRLSTVLTLVSSICLAMLRES